MTLGVRMDLQGYIYVAVYSGIPGGGCGFGVQGQGSSSAQD